MEISLDLSLTGTIVLSGAAPAPSLGPELITNGSFDSGASWTLSNGSISGGTLNFDSALGDNLAQQTLAGGSQPAGTYRISWDSQPGGGGIRFTLDAVSVTTSGSGSKSIDHVAAGPFSAVTITGMSGATGFIDNLSIKKVG